jgi:hypothetical protein
LFDSFRHSRDNRSPDREEATLHLLTFDLEAQRTLQELETQWALAQATGVLGSIFPGEAIGTASALAVRLSFAPSPDAAMPGESLLLAVRAARRALAHNPDDGRAFLQLGEAYLRLERQTREQSWYGSLPRLASIRRIQAMTALEQAALLQPDLAQAHTLLFRLHSEAGHLDRALDHMRAWLRIAEQQAQLRGPEADSAIERLPLLRKNVVQLEELVQRAFKRYEANIGDRTDPSKVHARADLAARHGLTRKALEMLLDSNLAIFGKAGLTLQVNLMLELGRAYEVRAWLEPEHERQLGSSSYHELRAQAAAACGDYAGADDELDQMSEQWRQVAVAADRLLPVRSVIAQRVAQAVLVRPAPGAAQAGLAGALLLQFDALRPLGGRPAEQLRSEADVRVLRGLLALEPGAVETTQRHCRAALAVWGDDRRAATGAGLDFAARPIAQQVLERMKDDG